MNNLYNDVYNIAIEKVKLNCQKIGKNLKEYPSQIDGKYFSPSNDSLRDLSHIYVWTTSFFTGEALLAYKDSKDKSLLSWSESFYERYREKVNENKINTMHDLGFLYTLYSTMLYRLTKQDKWKDLSIDGANVLASRFVENGNYIRAWGRMDNVIPPYIEDSIKNDRFFIASDGLAIIDCMMNIPLLFFAYEQTKNTKYWDVATKHANTTMKYFIREDYSVSHAFSFDKTGNPCKEENDCGYSIGSHWARGSAWAIYGFTIAYNYTKDSNYLSCSINLLNKYLDECNKKDQIIPTWDFRLPNSQKSRYSGRERSFNRWDISDNENTKYNVDSSAAVIICLSIKELLKIESSIIAQNKNKYLHYYNLCLDLLCNEYVNLDCQTPGLLKAQNGNYTYAIYGDYFFMELLSKEIFGDFKIW